MAECIWNIGEADLKETKIRGVGNSETENETKLSEKRKMENNWKR